MRTLLALPLSLLFATSALGAAFTRGYQNGPGYSGVTDTYISDESWDTPPQHTINYGQNVLLYLNRDGRDNILLRFDISNITTQTHIESAFLVLRSVTASTVPRRIAAYAILKPWDEGNQTNGQLNAPGRHGTTGDHAFAYFPGEGTNVPWSSPGMAPGTDYDATAVSQIDVAGVGEYRWDVTALVRAWVRGHKQNHGIVLRDLTGYNEVNPDNRDFHSSQSAETSLRPMLEIRMDPDVKDLPPNKWRR